MPAPKTESQALHQNIKNAEITASAKGSIRSINSTVYYYFKSKMMQNS